MSHSFATPWTAAFYAPLSMGFPSVQFSRSVVSDSATPWTACCCSCSLVAKLCPTLCDPMDYSPPASSVHGILQARILAWENPFSRWIFRTQKSNPGLLLCRGILYHLSHQGIPSMVLVLGFLVDVLRQAEKFLHYS